MARTNWNRQFFVSTRGRIITLLRRSSRTVDELAQALDLTHTAVRAHLAALERDGLVHQHSERRGGRKPSAVYDLAQAAEDLFPKSYGQLLDQLLDILQERMKPEEVETLLREVGRRMAAEWKLPPAELHVQLEAAVNVFHELGGLAELEECDGHACLRGYRCPFAAVVREHPEICSLAETLLSELVGVPMQEHCYRTGPVPCRFVVLV
jgi:predicted ArsR family transcriptional regulator